MQQEHHAYGGDHEAFLDQGPFQGGDGAMDQLGAVIDRRDAHALGKTVGDLAELRLHVIDDVERVLSKALHGDAADRFALAGERAQAASLVGAQLDPRHIADQDRRGSAGLQHDQLQVGGVP